MGSMTCPIANATCPSLSLVCHHFARTSYVLGAMPPSAGHEAGLSPSRCHGSGSLTIGWQWDVGHLPRLANGWDPGPHLSVQVLEVELSLLTCFLLPPCGE